MLFVGRTKEYPTIRSSQPQEVEQAGTYGDIAT